MNKPERKHLSLGSEFSICAQKPGFSYLSRLFKEPSQKSTNTATFTQPVMCPYKATTVAVAVILDQKSL